MLATHMPPLEKKNNKNKNSHAETRNPNANGLSNLRT